MLIHTKRKHGFTLLEMIIALALFAGIIAIAISLISITSQSIVDESKVVSATQTSTTAIRYIVADTKSAESMYVTEEKMVFYLPDGQTISYVIDSDHNTVTREDDEIITGYRLFQVIPIDEVSFMLTLGLRGAETMQYTFTCTGEGA